MMNLHEVKQLFLDNGPEAVSEIARNAQKQRTAARAVIPLGLSKHPGIVDLLSQNVGSTRELNRSQRRKVVDIIFHLDGPTLMKYLPSVSRPGDDRPLAPPAGLGIGRVYEQLWCKAAGPFMKKKC